MYVVDVVFSKDYINFVISDRLTNFNDHFQTDYQITYCVSFYFVNIFDLVYNCNFSLLIANSSTNLIKLHWFAAI